MKNKVPKNIINLVEDVKCLVSHFTESWLEYFYKIINKDADVFAKRLICNVLL